MYWKESGVLQYSGKDTIYCNNIGVTIYSLFFFFVCFILVKQHRKHTISICNHYRRNIIISWYHAAEYRYDFLTPLSVCKNNNTRVSKKVLVFLTSSIRSSVLTIVSLKPSCTLYWLLVGNAGFLLTDKPLLSTRGEWLSPQSRHFDGCWSRQSDVFLDDFFVVVTFKLLVLFTTTHWEFYRPLLLGLFPRQLQNVSKALFFTEVALNCSHRAASLVQSNCIMLWYRSPGNFRFCSSQSPT